MLTRPRSSDLAASLVANLVRPICSATGSNTAADVARLATFSGRSMTFRMATLSKVLGIKLETPKAMSPAAMGR
jgi:hypothetical protein